MSRPVDVLPPADALKVKSTIDQWLGDKIGDGGKVLTIRRWAYGVVAALLIGLAGTGVYLFVQPKPQKAALAGYKNDLPPGRDKAVLKLSNGKTVELNEATTGPIPNQDDAAIDQANGWLRYKPGSEVRFNNLFTPVGGQIKLLLPDGSRVWLDASSSIRFPTAFPSGMREVAITGQAYFEIAPNPKQPFVVHAKDQTIKVLGTQFNINSYGDADAVVKTTLEQGSILVSSASANKPLLLTPGEQASGMTLVKDVDMEAILAWKNGEFRFNGASMESIMEQAARWYGAEIVYKDKITEEFVARVPRNVPVSKLLKYLEETGQVHFQVEGNKIIVMK